MGLFEKIISLIINFTLIFEPLAIRIPLTPAQAQQDQPLEFEVEIVPVSSGITDVFGAVGNYYCNPYEANVFTESLYKKDGEKKTVVEKVKERLTLLNEGCETVWPQLLLRFIANTSSSALADVLSRNTTTLTLNVNLNFNNESNKDLNIEYKITRGGRVITSNIRNNIPLWWFGGLATPTIREISKDRRSFFDAYVTFRSQYYLRDEPDLNKLVSYNYPIGNRLENYPNTQELDKRFILKGLNLQIGNIPIEIRKVRFFKDVLDYYNYKEKIKDTPTLEFDTTSFNIIGFFPTFIESLPLNAPDFVENNLCSYYYQKGGTIYLIPFQHTAVWNVSVLSVGDCNNPPFFNDGITNPLSDLCFKYTNKTRQCNIVAQDGTTSTSVCSLGVSFVNRFYNATVGDKYYWDINKKKDYNIIKTINEELAHHFPSLLSLAKSSTSEEVKAWIESNNEAIDYFLNKRRILTFSTLQYTTSDKLVYIVSLLKDCQYKGRDVVIRKRTGYMGSIDESVDIYVCSTPAGKVKLAISPEDYTPPSIGESCEFTQEGWKSLINHCEDEFFIFYNENVDDSLPLSSSFSSFLKTYNPIVTTTDTLFPPSEIIFIIPSTSINKYEYKLVDFLPRIYSFNTTTYIHHFLSPGYIKEEIPISYKHSPLWEGLPYFGSFENFTSKCTLPQDGFDVSLYVNPSIKKSESPTASGENEATTRMCEYNEVTQQQYCREVTYPIVRAYECYGSQANNIATATIEAKYDLTFFTKKYDNVSNQEKLDIFLKANSALIEYRKGRNISKIEFNILEKNPNEKQYLNVATIPYKRRYIPSPTLENVAEIIATTVGLDYKKDIEINLPQEIKERVSTIKDSVVREILSHLPLVLDLDEEKTSFVDVLESNQAINQVLYINWYPAIVMVGGKEEKKPWLVFLAFFLRKPAKIFKSLALLFVGAGLAFLPIGSVLTFVKSILYIPFLVLGGISYIFYPPLVNKIFGDYSILVLGATYMRSVFIPLAIIVSPIVASVLTVKWLEDIAKQWYASISERETEIIVNRDFTEVLKEYGLYKEFQNKIGVYKELIQNIKNFEQPCSILFCPTLSGLNEDYIKPLTYYQNEMTKLKNAGISEKVIEVANSEAFIGISTALFAGLAYSLFTQMMALGGIMLEEDERTVRKFWLEAVNLSYGYKLENIKLKLSENYSIELLPIFTIYGVPVYDPLYPEYGFYEPLRRFLGNPIEIKPICETVDCIINSATGDLTVSSTISNYQSILGGNIVSFSEGKSCELPWMWSDINSTLRTEILSETERATITLPYTSTSTIIGVSLVGEKYNAEIGTSLIGSPLIKRIFTSSTAGVISFVDSFIKAGEGYSTITMASFTNLGNATEGRLYTCVSGSSRKDHLGVYALFRISSTKSYALNCEGGKTPKFKGINTYNTCLGWRCEYDPNTQPSLTTTAPQ